MYFEESVEGYVFYCNDLICESIFNFVFFKNFNCDCVFECKRFIVVILICVNFELKVDGLDICDVVCVFFNWD